MQVSHLSMSQMNMFLRCPYQYYCRYIQGFRVPPRSALTLGASFHKSIAMNYRQKYQSKVDLPLGDVLDAFSTVFDDMSKETEWQKGEDSGQVKDTGIQTLSLYQPAIAREVHPIEVEQRFSMTFKNRDYSFVGVVDLVDETPKIIETKTTSKTPSEAKVEHKLQTVAYSAGHRARTKQKEEGVRIDYAVVKKEPGIVSYPVVVEQSDIEYFLKLMDSVARGIENEIWIPNRMQILCSRRWCGFWNECEKANGGRVRD